MRPKAAFHRRAPRATTVLLAVALAVPALVTASGPPAGAATGDISTILGGGATPVVDGTPVPGTEATMTQINDVARIGGTLYLADAQSSVVYAYDTDDETVRVIAGQHNNPGISGDDGPAIDAQLMAPVTIAVSGSTLLVAGMDTRIRAIDLDTGIITTLTGSGPGHQDGPLANAQFSSSIAGLTATADGLIYVADGGNHVLRCIGCDGPDVVSTIAGTPGVRGYSADGTNAADAQFTYPTRVAVDPSDGALVFADFCDVPAALADYSNGPVGEDHCSSTVRRIDAGTGVLSTLAGVHGTTRGDDDGPVAGRALAGPISVSFEASGSLLISEVGATQYDFACAIFGRPCAADLDFADVQPRLRRLQGGVLTSVAGPGFAIEAISYGNLGDGGPATSAGFGGIAGTTPDAGTHIYAIDMFNGRLRKIEGERPNLVTSIGSIGSVTVGSVASVPVTVTNGGAGFATGPITATITLPSGVSYHSVVGTGWSCVAVGGTVTCENDTHLAASAALDFTIKVNTTSVGTKTVGVAVVSDSDDLNPAAGITQKNLTVNAAVTPTTAPPPTTAPVPTVPKPRHAAPGPKIRTIIDGMVHEIDNGAPNNTSVVGAASTATGEGAWTVATDGGVFTSGDAPFHGSLGGTPLNTPIAAIAPTPTGAGYYLSGRDGGVFTFGDAPFHGSLGGIPLNDHIIAIAPTPTGGGYWLLGHDGGVFTFGDAEFFGSLAGIPLNAPPLGIFPTTTGGGYWILATDGGIFTFGDAPYLGNTLGNPAISLAPTTNGYTLLHPDGTTTNHN